MTQTTYSAILEGLGWKAQPSYLFWHDQWCIHGVFVGPKWANEISDKALQLKEEAAREIVIEGLKVLYIEEKALVDRAEEEQE